MQHTSDSFFDLRSIHSHVLVWGVMKAFGVRSASTNQPDDSSLQLVLQAVMSKV